MSESSIAAGVRRIEAVAGKRALEYTDQREEILKQLTNVLEVPVEQAVEQLERFIEQQKQLQSELNQYKRKAVADVVTDLAAAAEVINDVSLVVAEVDLTEAEQLRSLGDKLRERLQPSVIFLGARTQEKVLLVAMATKDIAGKAVHAGNVIKTAAQICGGGGGGRPDMAQAGDVA